MREGEGVEMGKEKVEGNLASLELHVVLITGINMGIMKEEDNESLHYVRFSSTNYSI